MNRKKTAICMSMGLALLMCAVAVLFYNYREDRRAAKVGEDAMIQLKKIIAAGSLTGKSGEAEIMDNRLRRIMIGGNTYCGYLIIEKLGLQLPVLVDVNDYKLQLAPCVYYGTIEDNNLIIAAHNYKSHFGKINQLVKDDKIIFVDICGIKHEFRVDKCEIIGKDMKEKMLDSAYQLTLFTCDYSGQNRVTVRCKSEE